MRKAYITKQLQISISHYMIRLRGASFFPDQIRMSIENTYRYTINNKYMKRIVKKIRLAEIQCNDSANKL